MAKDWAQTEVPHESILYMGASLEYSPTYEAQKPETCKACGGVVITENGDWIPRRDDDPVCSLDTVVVVCLCSRSNFPGKLRGREHTPNHKRPSHRAGRITGKPDADLNPYLKVKKKRKPRKAG